MKKRIGYFTLAVFITSAFFSVFAQTPDKKIIVMNPVGIKPAIKQIPMADRPDKLGGKTIYIVNTKFPRTREFVETLAEILQEKYPKTNWVLKDKFGGYMDDDPKLWSEIKEKAAGAIVTVGH
ncbi:hypothetical protein ACFL1N_04120 [Thermodesulfobacteriota bacterium]